MIDYKVCRKVLEQDGEQYTDEEIKLVADLLWEYAQMSVEHFLTQKKTNRMKWVILMERFSIDERAKG